MCLHHVCVQCVGVFVCEVCVCVCVCVCMQWGQATARFEFQLVGVVGVYV